MTIYADDMRRYAMVDRGSGRPVAGRWSHLMADSPDELAGFAARLGLRPEWVQFPGTAREHYDIVEAVRRRAVAAGAFPLSYPRGTELLILTKRLQASALDAAFRGWQVFPLRPGSKIPAVRDWEHRATADPERVRELWTVRLQRGGWHIPEPPNLGIACGPSGLVVIDLDVGKPGQGRSGWPEQWLEYDVTSGAQVLAAVADLAWGTVPETYVVATPSGGRHLYFAAPDGVHLRNSAGHPGPLIDVRGDGGYVVAAGSHLRANPGRDGSAAGPGGLGYRLVEDRPPAELPDWLTAAIAAGRQRDHNPPPKRDQIEGSRRQGPSIRSAPYAAAALQGEADRIRSAPVGQRNHTLNTAAYNLGQLVTAGALDQDRAVEALTAAAESAGLTTAEIRATIDSGLTAGAQRPRAMATTSGDAPDTRGSRADGPTSPSTDRRPSDAPEDQPSDSSQTTNQSDGRPHTRGDSTDRPVPKYSIDEHDAAIGGWLFDEAFSAWRDSRTPCYPADTLRLACEHEGLPTDGKSDRRFTGRPRSSGWVPAPGEELLDRDVWEAMTQAQRDTWNLRRTDRPDMSALTSARQQPEGQDTGDVRQPHSFETAMELATARSGAPEQVTDRAADVGKPARESRTELDRRDHTQMLRETVADALLEAAHAVAAARNSGDGSVADWEVDQLSDAAYAALEAWAQPAAERAGKAGASETPSEEPRQVGSLLDDARPAATPEESVDAHAALNAAIEHARAAVAHLEASRAATRGQSGSDAPDAAVSAGRPAYWAEPEVDL